MGEMFQALVLASPDVCVNNLGVSGEFSFGQGPRVLGLLEAADLAPSSRAVGLCLLYGALQRALDLPRQGECLSCSWQAFACAAPPQHTQC